MSRFSFKARFKSFIYAGRGIRFILVSQHNAWVHAVATLVVCMAGVILKLSGIEWSLIILAILSVWAAEAFNTAFEFLADVASPEFHPLVKKAKDTAAAAVLIAAIGALVIGGIVFLPYLV